MLLTLDAVRKTHGTTTLLDGVSLGIDDTQRIGVVGRNGAGKSTLLRIVAEREAPDEGRVAARSDLRIGLLDQTDVLPAGTIGSLVLGDRIEHEWAGSAATRSVLDGLEIRHRLHEDTTHLSGGERRRVALARLLVTDALEGLDLLVLDEPTNHLDVEGVAWLADFLRRRRRALLVVTHDRWFLDEVCDVTWEVAGGAVNAYEGGYAAYVLARAERERVAATTEARRSNLLRKELAWLRRGPPARTSKPQFRIDAANALIADEPPARQSMTLLRAASARLGKSVYDVEDVTLGYGEKKLLEHVTWRIGPGDRLAVVGVNGAGKSTLLRLLAGELQAMAGHIAVGQTVRPAYLSQLVAELDPRLRVLEAVEEVGRYLAVESGGSRELTAGQLLESFGFAAAKQWTRVGDLSGGERRRLQILRLLLGGANVLLLDEPTNDLDIETLQALEDVLDGWPGTLIVVSHDRYFVERVADSTMALLGDGSLRQMIGGIDEYLERRAKGGATPAVSGEPVPTGGNSRGGESRGGDTRVDEKARGKELTRLERLIVRLDKREKALHEQLAEAAADHAKALALDAELREVLAEKISAEDAWLDLAEG
ncbi:MAG: transport system ATP-binding/permease protein [Frankiaceae bacterium]|nr:transport system ATP-binding/permease protein [Frankiaceae bacterium]MDQ1636174.1 transport system ATP-binding/permease protein [Frankiaceae bacterium]MDQ1671685.1 transport system ATP-binding/permease protein [Frankiaceae bacterium]